MPLEGTHRLSPGRGLRSCHLSGAHFHSSSNSLYVEIGIDLHHRISEVSLRKDGLSYQWKKHGYYETSG